MSSVDAPRYLTAAQTAERFQVSLRTVRRRIADGSMPAVRLGGPGTPVRIPERELLEWLDADPPEEAA